MKIQKLKCNDRKPPRTPDGILFTTAALLSLLTVAFSAAGQSISWEPVQAPRTGIAVTPAASATTTIERAAARDQHFYTKTGRFPDTFEAPFMPIPTRTFESQSVDQKSAAPLDERPPGPPLPRSPSLHRRLSRDNERRDTTRYERCRRPRSPDGHPEQRHHHSR